MGWGGKTTKNTKKFRGFELNAILKLYKGNTNN